MKSVRSLTPDQLDAVEKQDRVCLVLAPAGSGKTEVLIRRIIRILDESVGESFRVLAVTYTRKAAEELKRRVKAGIGGELWRVDANTIHALAFDWLKRFGQPVGVAQDVVVYSDTADRLLVLRDYLTSLGTSADESFVRDLLGKLDRFSTEPEPDQIVVDELGLSLREVRDAYLQSLEAVGGLDFSAMLEKFRELLNLDPSTLKRFRRTYDHVLVDEGQDLTEAQALLLKELVGTEMDLFVVADDRQSINRWAGGGIEWARTLVEPSYSELHLLHNFRCATGILEVAHRVAGHFSQPRPEALQVPGAPPGDVQVQVAANEVDEANLLAQWVTRLLDEGLPVGSTVPGESSVIEPEEVGIVARARFRLDEPNKALRNAGVPVSILTDARDILRSPEGRLFHAVLSLASNPNDRPAFRRAEEEARGLLRDELPLGEKEAEPGQFSEFLSRMATGTPVADLVNSGLRAVSPSAFEGELRTMLATLPESDLRSDLLEVVEWWNTYRASTHEADRSIPSFLNYVFQMHQTRPDDPGVRMLTTHRAKGLEFRAVAVLGLTQGSFPDYRSTSTSAALDEERRAFYVAVTRSSRVLLLTWSQQSTTRYGRRLRNQPSQFLQEAGLIP